MGVQSDYGAVGSNLAFGGQGIKVHTRKCWGRYSEELALYFERAKKA